jgi:K+-sensing histidine kinase KdpD
MDNPFILRSLADGTVDPIPAIGVRWVLWLGRIVALSFPRDCHYHLVWMGSVPGKDCEAPPDDGTQSFEQSDDYRMLRLALHEMRTPLTAVQLNAQLIERSLTKLGLEKECRLASMIVSSVRKLDALTQDLGEVARLHSGKACLDVRTHDLSRLLPELLSRHAGEMDVGRIRVAVPAGPLPMAVDARRLDRILANLLPIALNQDSQRSGIDLQVVTAEARAHFTVTAHAESAGTAPGVPSEEALGLGALVARFLVERHGGELEISQEAARDLVLRFWLPLTWKP